jgi:hypothetical protein
LPDGDVTVNTPPSPRLRWSVGNKRKATGDLRFVWDEVGGYFPAPDEWGTAYTSMSGKGLQDIEFLLEKQDGFVPADKYTLFFREYKQIIFS